MLFLVSKCKFNDIIKNIDGLMAYYLDALSLFTFAGKPNFLLHYYLFEELMRTQSCLVVFLVSVF